jgi:ubiquinol-cytochrome c reductase cytochrome b subunit
MSFWGAQVIVNLFAAVPVVGEDLSIWVRGDYVISDVTLNRFFAFHFLLPFVLVALVFVHIVSLHKVGSNNPDGIEIKKGPKGNRWDAKAPADGIPFHPYYSVKDMVGVGGFLILFAAAIFFAPEMFGYFIEAPNFEPANPLKTPAHIAPVWYFTPFYAMLRAVPPMFDSQFPGVVVMFAAILILFFLPWLDRSPVKSIRYRGILYKSALAIFVVTFLVLGYLGTEPVTVWGQFGSWLGNADVATVAARVFTVIYFAFFLLMPWYTAIDKTRPVPDRVTM